MSPNIFAALRNFIRSVINVLNCLSPTLTAFATLGVIGVAYWQWYELHSTDLTLRETLVATNRAWIAPVDMKLISPVVEGERIRYRLFFQNTGRAPAQEVVFQDDESDVRKAPMSQFDKASEPNSIDWIPQPTCVPLAKRRAAHNGWPFIYPTNKPIYTFDFESDRAADKDIVDGKLIQLAKGCFLYNTMSKKGLQSSYCFYLQHPKSASSEWKFQRCAFGNLGN